ncbi:MAG: ATP-binding protein [Promethearchaeota archaeon]
MAEFPIIDKGKCQGCGLCVSVCEFGAIILVDNKATIIQMMDCNWCTICEAVCPNGAIACPFEIIIEDKQ